MPLIVENRQGWVCTTPRFRPTKSPGLVQPELLRDVRMMSTAGTSSSCCLVSPGLGVSWAPPPSTHTAGLGPDVSRCLCVEPRDRNASSRKSSCRSTGHQAPSWESGAPHPSSALAPPCSVPSGKPFTHRWPQSPHLYDHGRHPAKPPLTQIPVYWELLGSTQGEAGKGKAALDPHHFPVHLDKGCSITPEPEPAKYSGTQYLSLICSGTRDEC